MSATRGRSQNTPVMKALAAAALHPELRSVLLFDASVEELELCAELMQQMLEVATRGSVDCRTLASFHSEEDLWGTERGLPVDWFRVRPLVAPEEISCTRLLVIHDLANTGLPTARACVQLTGASVACLERRGQHRVWRPRLAWLAACQTEDIGKVPNHVLDRFPVRLHTPLRACGDRVDSLRSWLEREDTASPLPQQADMGSLIEAVGRRRSCYPAADGAVVAKVVEALQDRWGTGVRRGLALARLATALACLAGDTKVEQRHVEEAAGLFGMSLGHQSTEPPKRSGDLSSEAGSRAEDDAEPRPSGVQPRSASGQGMGTRQDDTDAARATDAKGNEPRERVVATDVDAAECLEHEPQPGVLIDPFPEDAVTVTHEYAPLKLHLLCTQSSTEERGTPIGVCRARDLRDVAVVPTLFAAAPHQMVRHGARGDTGQGIIVEESDLRTWRRAATPADLLVILLDATSYGECDWQAAIVPYVREAYLSRAEVCVVLVGASGAPDEYRAERILARSVLVPEVARALSRPPGRATPLAHGLLVAMNVLRDLTHRGRTRLLRAKLVILSDGKGNVPLKSSQSGRLRRPVGRKGIEDALEMAERVPGLRGVEVALLDPQTPYGHHITQGFAAAMGVTAVQIPLRETTELRAP